MRACALEQVSTTWGSAHSQGAEPLVNICRRMKPAGVRQFLVMHSIWFSLLSVCLLWKDFRILGAVKSEGFRREEEPSLKQG